MRINPVLLIITFAISALAGYGFFVWNSGEEYQLLAAVGAGITIFLPLAGLIAAVFGKYGSTGNIRALSAVFLALEIISSIIFSMVNMTAPSLYIIINGILLLAYILIGYAITAVA